MPYILSYTVNKELQDIEVQYAQYQLSLHPPQARYRHHELTSRQHLPLTRLLPG